MDEASLAHLPLTRVAQFLTGHRPVLVHGPGVGEGRQYYASLCGPIPNRPQACTGPWPRGWGGQTVLCQFVWPNS